MPRIICTAARVSRIRKANPQFHMPRALNQIGPKKPAQELKVQTNFESPPIFANWLR